MIGEELMTPNSEAESLRQQLLQAQRLSTMGTLASSVAHEFNNILTTIINYAKLGLKPQSDDRNRTESLEKILKGSQRARTIVNSMLGFARNTVNQRTATDLATLVDEVIILADKDLSKHPHSAREEIPRPPPEAPVVAGQIRQILLNLDRSMPGKPCLPRRPPEESS